MKKATSSWSRMLSMALAVCMLFGIVATPCSYLVAHAEANTLEVDVTSKVSTPIYTDSMDTIDGYYPTGWTRPSKAQNALASQIILPDAAGERQYYQMKRSGGEDNGISYATANPISDYSAVVLKYDVMVDNGDITEFSVYLPAFTNEAKSRAIALTIKDGVLANAEKTMTPGTWYTFELILVGSDWKLFVDGEKVLEGSIGDKTITCLNMGIANRGGHTAEGQVAGTDVAFNIDNMAIYSYCASTSIQFGKTNYYIQVGDTVTPAWNLAPANGYIPYISYSSDNELVATVDADTGVVTGVAEGTATIIATPAPSTGLLPITTTVTVMDPSNVGNANEGLVSVPVYTNSMDALNTGNNLYPTDWVKASGAQNARASSIVTDAAGGRQYYQMKRNSQDTNANSWATMKIDTGYESVVLKYDVMIDNGDITTYTVHLPAFTNDAKARAIALNINDGVLANTEKTLVPGLWYTFELILVGSDWKLFVDGVKVLEGSIGDKTITCLNMGIANRGGHTAEGQYPGTDVAFNIDNMAVYTYQAATEFTSEKAACMVFEGYKTSTAWKVAPEKAYLPYVTYTSSDETVVKVDANGVLTGVATGSAVITATPAPSTGLAPATVTVRVVDTDSLVPVTGVAINETNVKVKVGATAALTATISPADATVKDVIWTSSDPAVATVDQVSGIVTGVKAGTATITVTTDDGGKTDTVDVTVEDVRATGVTINDGVSTVTVVAGKSTPLYAVVTPVGAIDQTVIWSSNNEAVATVDPNTGALAGVSAGTAVITASVVGTQITDTIDIVVTQPGTVKCFDPIYENAMDAINNDGSSNALYPLGWAKENTVAQASEIVTAGGRTYWQMKVGESGVPSSAYALYTFKDAQGNEAPLTVNPVSLKYSVMVNNEGSGWTTYLPAFTNAERGRLFTFTIASNKLVAGQSAMTVESGKWYDIELVLDSTAWTVYINGGKFASGTLAEEPSVSYINTGVHANSINKAANIGINIDNLSVHAHDECTYSNYTDVAFEQTLYTFDAAAAVTPTLTGLPSGTSVTYVSTNKNVAAVDVSGKITVTGIAGTAMILAYADGCTVPIAAISIVTVKPVTGVKAEDVNLHVGGHQYLNPIITPSDADLQNMLYTSNNPAVATVDEWGEVVAISKGTAQITITSEEYPNISTTVTVTVTDAAYQSTIYVSVNGGGDGSSKNSPMTLQQAMDKVATMDKSQGSVVVELAAGYYKQTQALNFLAEHGGNNDNFVIYRGAQGAKVTIGGAEILDDEIVSGFAKVEGKDYYVMQLNKDIDTRHLIVNGVRATRARSDKGLTDPQLIQSGDTYLGLSCTDTFLLDIPADDQEDLEFSYCVEWANHRGGAQSITLGEDGRVQIVMDQPNFQTLATHSNIGLDELVAHERNYTMFYENALMLLDEPGEWYFDNEEKKLYYMPYAWENVDNLTVSYPVIDDWTQDGMTDADSGLVNILGNDSGIVQNIKFENIIFADTTYSRTSTDVGLSASQGMHIRDANTTSADTMPDAAITLAQTNSIYFTNCTFTRLGITGINMYRGSQNVQIIGSVFSDISGNGMYIGQTNWRNMEIYNPSDPLMVVKNCDVYNCYMHDMGTEYQSASAIAVGYAAYVNLENNEIFNVAYSPIHIGLGWGMEIHNVLRHTTVRGNFIHDFNYGGVWDSGGIYVNGTTSGNLDPFAGTGNNLISGNYIRNMGVGTAPLYNDSGADNWIWEYNVVDLSEVAGWYNNKTSTTILNKPQWLTVGASNSPCLIRNNYTSTAWTRANFDKANGSGRPVQANYNEASLNDNNLSLVFQNNTVCEDGNWPEEARNLMANAGLTGAYAALRNNHPERLVTDLPDEDETMLDLGVGETFNINLRATDGKNVAVDLAGATIAYVSGNPSVAKVSDTGVITAVGVGETVISVYVMVNDIVQTVERSVTVHSHTYTNNGENHTVTCEVCELNETVEHTYEDGACICGDVLKFTAIWQNWDGTVLETDENVPYGTTPEYTGATPTKEGDAQYSYTFTGWDPEVSAVTGEVTYTATFTESLNIYVVTWNVNGVETNEPYKYGEMPSFKGSTDKAADENYTYEFTGWTPAVDVVTGDVTYTAVYEAIPVVPAVSGTINLSTLALELESIIYMKFYCTVEGFEGYDLANNMGLMMWTGDGEYSDEQFVMGNENVTVSEGGSYELNAANGRYYWVARTPGIDAKKMGDEYKIRAYVKLPDGSYVYSTKNGETQILTHGVQKYALNLLTTSNDNNLKKAVVAMMDYAAKAQVAFKHRTDNLANELDVAELTDPNGLAFTTTKANTILAAMETYKTAYSADMIIPETPADSAVVGDWVRDTEARNNVGVGGTLVLEGIITNKYTFTVKVKDVVIEKAQFLYWETATYAELLEKGEAFSVENATGVIEMSPEADGTYIGLYNKTAAKELSNTLYVCGLFTTEDGTVYDSGIVVHGGHAFLKGQVNKTDDYGPLAQALVVYGEAAKTYFANRA